MAKNNFYVIWNPEKKGIYTNWDVCKKNLKGLKQAQYMGFPDRESAEEALKHPYARAVKSRKKASAPNPEALKKFGMPNLDSIAVDAASSGNPGRMEYRGVDTRTGKQLFYQGPFEEGTNNIGEFLAIVHGLAFLKGKKSTRVIYSDSRIAMGWVRKKKCNTKLKESKKNAALFDLIRRAEIWLKSNTYTTPVVKWETKAWGEIPADFGRK